MLEAAVDNLSSLEPQMEVNKLHLQLLKWHTKLPDGQKGALNYLLMEDAININVEDESIELWIVLNDTFGFACADGEDVKLTDLQEISKIYQEMGHTGLIAWAANKRGVDPLKELIDKEYLEAVHKIRHGET